MKDCRRTNQEQNHLRRTTRAAFFIAHFAPRASDFVSSRRLPDIVPPTNVCPRLELSPSAVHSNGEQRRPRQYGARRNPAQRRNQPIMKEILSSQRLRKQGKWREAQALLASVRTEGESDSNYLNEMMHLHVAQLSQTKPNISAAELWKELYTLTESVPARSNATTFNAILLGLRNISGSRKKRSEESSVFKSTGKEMKVVSEVFDAMINEQLSPDHFTMSILFQMSGSNQSLHHTKLFEEKAKNTFGFEANVISGSALLAAYAKCGEISCVEEVLYDLQSRNVVLNERTYASLISAYHRSGKHAKVMQCFREAINSPSVQPNIFVFSGALASCWKTKDAANAKKVLEAMEAASVCPTPEIFETLFEIAVRSGDVNFGALVLLDRAPKHKVFSPTLNHFNKLISACKKSLLSTEKTVDCLKTIVTRLKEETDLSPSVSTLNALISSFIKLGCYAEAQTVLERDFQTFGLRPDVVTYNTLIHCLGKVKGPSVALKVYNTMVRNGIRPNQVTYNSMFDTLLDAGETETAAKIAEQMKQISEKGIDSMSVSSELKLLRRSKDYRAALRSYLKARKATHDLDLETHGLMLTILVESNCEAEVVSLFGWLVWKRIATPKIFNIVLDYFGRTRKDMSRAMTLFGQMKQKGIAPDETTYSILIHICSQNGLIDRAFRILGEMQDVGVGVSDTHAWSSLIDGCGRAGQWQRAVDLLKSMHSSGARYRLIPRPTTPCYNAAIYAAGMRGGGWKEALEVYQLLVADENQEANVVTCSAMASTILRNRYDISEWNMVRQLYNEIQGLVRYEMENGSTSSGPHPYRGSSSLGGKIEKASLKKLVKKMKRLNWVLEQALDGKKLKKLTEEVEADDEEDEV